MTETSLLYPARRLLVLGGFSLAALLLLARDLGLQVIEREFLKQQGDARHIRVADIPAHRGMITDRDGEPLAISTPVDSVWANPRELALVPEQWAALAQLLDLDPDAHARLISERQGREFVYLRRHIDPELARQVTDLQVPGVSLQREYRRYYPTGEVSAHLVGFTNIDDRGQEGIELMFDQALRGTPGSKRVIKDRLGRVIENVAQLQEPKPGRDLRLSIDRRLQYLAYRELKAAVQRHGAQGGSAVVLDALSGELLAMVNQPAFNPNNRGDRESAHYRNRAVTDVFEPGSSIKPFTIAAALESGQYGPQTAIDTAPGWVRIGNSTISDIRNYGRLDLTGVLQKSSNVGASRIALSLNDEALWKIFTRVGFGVDTGSAFPGEIGGTLTHYSRWSPIEKATLSYGYGLAVTPLQLARAFAVLAGDGQLRPLQLLARESSDASAPAVPAIAPATVKVVRRMLEAVVDEGGTGTLAAIPGYRIAGKTGTVRKVGAGGYAEDRYVAIFAGMAPASRPRLVMAVVIDEPTVGGYYGGQVAAPVFARVMGGALRLLDVPPDDLPHLKTQVADAGGAL